ncbi:hypothetical protein Ddye_011430 [Dipteronia dyeriana]|uniref:Uncharacterized protein n=1 Tax=Dipteronia dyeriana TaxID=168575 RepID=A0AAD9X2H0_9ROSI|nr:hypothetical protein Ddye_011430 [Dipteronia dyeriana]
MKKSSVPPPFYSSTISEEKAENTRFSGRNDNIRAARSQVTEKKSLEVASNNNNKLESQPSMDINESADAFIKKFRQQLLIQRLESIENYEQMLARGVKMDWPGPLGTAWPVHFWKQAEPGRPVSREAGPARHAGLPQAGRACLPCQAGPQGPSGGPVGPGLTGLVQR